MHPHQRTHPHNPSPKIIMEKANSNWGQLPLHWVGVPVQVPLLLHVLVVDPVKVYPLLQENSQLCPGKLEQCSRLPFGGAYSCWQWFTVKRNFFTAKRNLFSEIRRKSGEFQRCGRTEKTEEKGISYSLQCSQNVAGATLKNERIINARIENLWTFCVNSNDVW